MVTRLSDVDQHNMLHLFTALSGMDGPGIAKAVLSFSGQAASVWYMGLCASAFMPVLYSFEALRHAACCSAVFCTPTPQIWPLSACA